MASDQIDADVRLRRTAGECDNTGVDSASDLSVRSQALYYVQVESRETGE